MILDTFENLSSYCCLNSGFEKALNFLSRDDLKDFPPNKYEIEGEEIFAIIVNETGKDKNDGTLEIHQKYIDIQFVLSGTDEMGWKPKQQCSSPIGQYDKEKDVLFFNDKPSTWFSVKANSYAIFFPEDCHMAMFSENNIHKVIIKVAVGNND